MRLAISKICRAPRVGNLRNSETPTVVRFASSKASEISKIEKCVSK